MLLCCFAMSSAHSSPGQSGQASRSPSPLSPRARRQIENLPYVPESPPEFEGVIYFRTESLSYRAIDPGPPAGAIPPTPSGSNILRSSDDLTSDRNTEPDTGGAAGMLPPLEEFEVMSQEEKILCLYMALLRLQHLSR